VLAAVQNSRGALRFASTQIRNNIERGNSIECARWSWILGSVNETNTVVRPPTSQKVDITHRIGEMLKKKYSGSGNAVVSWRNGGKHKRSASVFSRDVFCEVDKFRVAQGKKRNVFDATKRFPFTLGVETVSERLFASNGFLGREEVIDSMKAAMNIDYAEVWWNGEINVQKQPSEFTMDELDKIRMCKYSKSTYDAKLNRFKTYVNVSRSSGFVADVTDEWPKDDRSGDDILIAAGFMGMGNHKKT